MKVLIIEDEIPTQRYLSGLIEQLRPEWSILAFIESIEDAVKWLNQNPKPDLIFSDIQLADGVCFEIFKQVNVSSSVIFTTAYDEYAIQAFKVNSIDYLLKPIDPDALLLAIEKFEKLRSKQNPSITSEQIQELTQSLSGGQVKYRQRFLANTADGFIKLNINDIAWFNSSNKTLSACTFKQKQYVIDQTLENLENQLDPTLFYRVNRQYILHIESVVKIENWFNGKLVVKTQPLADEKIVVSRDKARAFKEWLSQ